MIKMVVILLAGITVGFAVEYPDMNFWGIAAILLLVALDLIINKVERG